MDFAGGNGNWQIECGVTLRICEHCAYIYMLHIPSSILCCNCDEQAVCAILILNNFSFCLFRALCPDEGRAGYALRA